MSTTTTVALSPKAEAFLARVHGGVEVLNVEWTSSVKPAAAFKDISLTKTVSATVLTGVEYPNLLVNKGVVTGDLPWGTWAVYPHIVTHKGAEYARLNTVDGTLRTTYFADGVEVTREEFGAFLTPSARKVSRPHGGTITVKMANLTF